MTIDSSDVELLLLPNLTHSEQSYLPLKLAADMVSVFDGKFISVEYFIKQCKVAESFLKPGDKPLFKALIVSKLKDNAYLTEGDYPDMTQIFETLRACYSKIHDIDDVEDQIKDFRQKVDEKISDYAARVKKTLNMGIDFATASAFTSDLSSIATSLRTKAKKGFIKGLRNEILKGRVLDRVPETLDTAIQIAMRVEKELHEHAKHFVSDPRDVNSTANTNNDKFIK